TASCPEAFRAWRRCARLPAEPVRAASRRLRPRRIGPSQGQSPQTRRRHPPPLGIVDDRPCPFLPEDFFALCPICRKKLAKNKQILNDISLANRRARAAYHAAT